MDLAKWRKTPIGHQGIILTLLYLNIISTYKLLFGESPSKQFGIWSMIILIIILIISYRPKREEKILAKYEKKSEESRIIGNISVISYVILSIIFIVKV